MPFARSGSCSATTSFTARSASTIGHSRRKGSGASSSSHTRSAATRTSSRSIAGTSELIVRVVDLLFRYATPGTIVVDLTADRAELSNAARGTTDLGLPYERAPLGSLSATRSLVLHTLLEASDPSPFARA